MNDNIKKKSVVAIGTFDGVHKGHELVINKTLFIADNKNMKSTIVMIEKPIKKVSGVLMTYEEKIEKIKSYGVDEIFMVIVPSVVLSYDSDKFFDDFLIKIIRASEIVCGFDFAFGKGRCGDIKWLDKKRNDIKINTIKPLKHKSVVISSSYIRLLIKNGDMRSVKEMLGRNYSFNGVPFKDKGIGKKLGFPTVNLFVNCEKLLPRGVYISYISKCDNKIQYNAITNIGLRSTFGIDKKPVSETYILGFSGVWSDTNTKVTLLKKIRDEKKFLNVDMLIKQILNDALVASKFFCC
ncbi:MAG: riboflavin biosynthesis protein RibF [Endomicrobium sp.]|jgi:riboflavin kinase/FMN adenylyltransferase|nr:riboflavin biosynthesis protein RibF [Endomicrobium sp.]